MSFFNVYLQALFPGILFNLPISVGNGTQEMLETQTNKLKTKQHMHYTASVKWTKHVGYYRCFLVGILILVIVLV